MILDCHMHIMMAEHYDWEAFTAIQPEKVRRKLAAYSPEVRTQLLNRFPLERYFREMGAMEKAVLLPVRARKTYGIEIPNQFMANLAKQHPDKLVWCCAVDPGDKGAAEEIERCAKDGAVGIGELCGGYQDFLVNDEQCYPVWEVAGRLDLPVILHVGPSDIWGARLAQSDVALLDDVAIRFRNVKFVIAHLGWPTQYREAIYLMQKHENVFGDASGLIKFAGLDDHITSVQPLVRNPYWDWVEPLAYYFSRNWGHIGGKLLMGSDWPESSGANTIEQFTGINQMFRKFNLPEVSEECIHEVLHENWKRVFRL